MRLVECTLADAGSVRDACANLRRLCSQWDVLVRARGSLDPVGPFLETNFDEWEQSVRINFTGQMQITSELLANRRKQSSPGPCVLYLRGW